ncbi:hypothetical protein [Rhodococcus sp. LB1]|uniref:hypothetical protein n=1 Tax=Rhodococcus sp. LB1 TaxID=1807499 RepID=UPI000B2E148E|nr:hypothetical protein [Rhodococcus sp. LB1]
MSGFEILKQAREENAAAVALALDLETSRLPGGVREGVPVERWRALPDSEGEQT